MGDPKRRRKQYTTPSHPWQGARIDAENKLCKEYGLKNKREVWNAHAKIGNYRGQARRLIGKTDPQSEELKKELLTHLQRYGIIEKGAKVEDILAMSVNNVLERRLQTIVHKKGISNSPKDARQMIVHGHISMNGSIIAVPSAFILQEVEGTITYTGPQRLIDARKAPKGKPKKEEPVIEVPAAKAEEKKEAASEEKPKAEGKPAEKAPAEEKKEEPKEESK